MIVAISITIISTISFTISISISICINKTTSALDVIGSDGKEVVVLSSNSSNSSSNNSSSNNSSTSSSSSSNSESSEREETAAPLARSRWGPDASQLLPQESCLRVWDAVHPPTLVGRRAWGR